MVRSSLLETSLNSVFPVPTNRHAVWQEARKIPNLPIIRAKPKSRENRGRLYPIKLSPGKIWRDWARERRPAVTDGGSLVCKAVSSVRGLEVYTRWNKICIDVSGVARGFSQRFQGNFRAVLRHQFQQAPFGKASRGGRGNAWPGWMAASFELLTERGLRSTGRRKGFRYAETR